MNRKLTAGIILLLLLCFVTIGTALAQSPIVGVSEGEVFYYDHVSFWSSDDPNATIPQLFLQINLTDWVRVNITGVSGSTVYMENTAHFNDGNESVWSGLTDVANGNSTVTFGFLVLPANLGVNDTVNLSPYTSVPIIETVLRNYTSGERETNHYVTSSSSPSVFSTTNVYFDRATGVVVEYRIETNQTSGSYTTEGTELIELQSSVVWPAIPEFPSSTILVGLIAIVFTLLAITKMRKEKSQSYETQKLKNAIRMRVDK